VDLGSFAGQRRDRPRVELTVRNVGYGDARFRVHVKHLDPHKGQEAAVLDQPRGGLAPGMCARIVLAVSSVQRGTLTALVCVETADQCCEVPVLGYCSDGQEQLDGIHGLPSKVVQQPNDFNAPITSPLSTQAARSSKARHGQVKRDGDGIRTISGDHEGWFGEVPDHPGR
jgi:hypothetical protein